MPTYNGITIKIQISGEDVPEFNVETDKAAKKVTCWVPSETGREFSVILNAERKPQPWSANVKADGCSACNKAYMSGPVIDSNIGFCSESPTVDRPFVFSAVELVDDDRLLQASQATQVGGIEIACRYFKNLGTQENSTHRKGFESTRKLHEKAKKGISQRVGLGKAKERKPGINYIPEWKERIVTFIFRYRPLAYLQAQGIAPAPPRAPSPAAIIDLTQGEGGGKRSAKRRVLRAEVEGEPLEVSSTNEEDNEELQTLLVRELLSERLYHGLSFLRNLMQVKVAEVKARKRKQREDVGTPRKKVKQEGFSRVRGDEVVDLT